MTPPANHAIAQSCEPRGTFDHQFAILQTYVPFEKGGPLAYVDLKPVRLHFQRRVSDVNIRLRSSAVRYATSARTPNSGNREGIKHER